MSLPLCTLPRTPPPPLPILDPGPGARRCLDPTLRARHHPLPRQHPPPRPLLLSFPDSTATTHLHLLTPPPAPPDASHPLLDLSFLASLTLPPLPTFNPRCHRLLTRLRPSTQRHKVLLPPPFVRKNALQIHCYMLMFVMSSHSLLYAYVCDVCTFIVICLCL
jgi:hypothetical protein